MASVGSGNNAAPVSNDKKRKRPRAARACEFCRAKKYRCDELYPCGQCRSTCRSSAIGLADIVQDKRSTVCMRVSTIFVRDCLPSMSVMKYGLHPDVIEIATMVA